MRRGGEGRMGAGREEIGEEEGRKEKETCLLTEIVQELCISIYYIFSVNCLKFII